MEDDAISTVAPSESVSQAGSRRPQPSLAYLKQAARPPVKLDAPTKKLLLVDLNNCLLARKSRKPQHGIRPQPRPYLSTFLAYMLKSKWSLMIWSSSKPQNVVNMTRAMGLLPEGATTEQLPAHLVAIWTRDDLGLSPADYNRKCETTKDLDKVFARPTLGEWTQANTVLLDDSSNKATLQPYNHLHLPLFDPFGNAGEMGQVKTDSVFEGRSPARRPSDDVQVESWRRTTEWVGTAKQTSPRSPPGVRPGSSAFASFTSSRKPLDAAVRPFRPSPHFTSQRSSPGSPPGSVGQGSYGSPTYQSSPGYSGSPFSGRPSPSLRSPAGSPTTPTRGPLGASPRPSPAPAAASPISPPAERSALQTLRTGPPRSTTSTPTKPPPPSTSVAPSETGEDWRSDTALLRVIAALDLLSRYADVSSAIREGVVATCFEASASMRTGEDRLAALWADRESDAGTEATATTATTETTEDHEWERRGREACERVGVEVKSEFDEGWLARVK